MPICRRHLLATVAASALLAFPVAAEEPLDVVASFSILADMTEAIGGDRVVVTPLAGPDQDAHVFEPAPADAGRLAEADLVVVNGLGFEGWIDRLVAASGYAGTVVVASAAIAPLPAEGDDHGHDEHAEEGHDDHAEEDRAEEEGHEGHHHGAFDPHAWQDVTNARSYAATIAAALIAADPEGRAVYEANAAAYDAELAALDAEIREATGALPEGSRTILTSHDAFAYFGHAYGIVFLAPEGMSTHDEPSAAEVAALIEQIEHDGVAAVFMENISDNRMLERIAEDTGVAIGGSLYSDALSGPDGPAPTYVAMMRHNASQMAAALQAF